MSPIELNYGHGFLCSRCHSPVKFTEAEMQSEVRILRRCSCGKPFLAFLDSAGFFKWRALDVDIHELPMKVFAR